MQETTKHSISLAAKSLISWLMSLLGAFSLCSLTINLLQIELRPSVPLEVLEVYRSVLGGFSNTVVGWGGWRPPALFNDVLVIWLAIGRGFSRTYSLLNAELHRDAGLDYNGFHWGLLKGIRSTQYTLVRRFKGEHQMPIGVLFGFLVALLWPFVGANFLVSRSITKVHRQRIHTGATPHPSDFRKTELPPIGDELKPKFSKEELSYSGQLDSLIVVVSHVAMQIAVVVLLVAGFLVASWISVTVWGSM